MQCEGWVSRSLGISLQCTALGKSLGIPKLIYYAHTRYLDNYARTRSPHANLLKQGLGCGPDPNIPSTENRVPSAGGCHSTSSPSLRHSVSATSRPLSTQICHISVTHHITFPSNWEKCLRACASFRRALCAGGLTC